MLNPIQYSEIIDTKLTVLDLKVHFNDSTYILVEMQVRKFEEWINRTVVYTGFPSDRESIRRTRLRGDVF